MNASTKSLAKEKEEVNEERIPTTICGLCKREHEIIDFCPNCGACLYQFAKQIPDGRFPIFECTQCKRKVFWD